MLQEHICLWNTQLKHPYKVHRGSLCGCFFIIKFSLMSRNIWQKKRFEVLQRDWFACKYCWQKPPYVQLEVDHIMPRSEWWTNDINNLITACSNCNRWKWWNVLWTDSKNLYKIKLDDAIYKFKYLFYEEWNKNIMWMIDEKTKVLISMWVKNRFSREWEVSIVSAISKISEAILTNDFKKWWNFCEQVLFSIKDDMIDEIDWFFRLVMDDWWRLADINYTSRLNYLLTDNLTYDIAPYVLKKYTLFPELLQNG